MRKEDLRIVYMGTPEFAVEPLRCLVEGGYNIAGVITMPDKPAGRGHKVQFSPVKQYALEHGLPLLQPEKLKDETFVEALRALNADLQIVVAFRMLPEVVWNMPRLGTFNLHASLLPQYRGAAPINWAVINGDTETGITTFFLKHIPVEKAIEMENGTMDIEHISYWLKKYEVKAVKLLRKGCYFFCHPFYDYSCLVKPYVHSVNSCHKASHHYR